MVLRSNWRTEVQTGKVIMDRVQIEQIAAVGSITVVRGASLWRDRA